MAAMDMARGLQMLRLTMAAMATARGPLMPTMAATDMEATATARGPLMPTMAATDTEATAMARGLPMPTMAAMATAAMAMASNQTMEENHPPKNPNSIKILSHFFNQTYLELNQIQKS